MNKVRSPPISRKSTANSGADLLRILRLLTSEPLVHFAVLGAVVYFSVEAWRADHNQYRIVVNDQTIAQVVGKYRLQFGRDPDDTVLVGLIDTYLDEEILYREGLALGLDRNDEIVRRRIAQKVAFLRQDLMIPAEPGDAELERYFKENSARYGQPARTSFRHLYFSPDIGGSDAARRRAEIALEGLEAGSEASAVVSDPFPDQSAYVALGTIEVRRIFGATPMADTVLTAPVGRWSGPVRSGYGWHLIFPQSRTLSAAGDLVKIREQVREDWLRDAQASANAREMAKLRARYSVIRQERLRP